mgnify:CR=1 FL=1
MNTIKFIGKSVLVAFFLVTLLVAINMLGMIITPVSQ